jgi:hypothetical protein
MDWDRAIERNREALKRVLASLLAMAGLAGFTSPPHPELVEGAGEDGSARRGEAEPLAEPGEGCFSGARPMLPRHLHRAVLRLLRPAEAAARRLVIVAARGLVVELPSARPRRPKPKSAILRNGVGTGIVVPRNLPPRENLGPYPRRSLCLPLTDTLPRWRGPGRTAAKSVPRISFPGFGAPFPVPVRRPPLANDPIDAGRLALRLAALAAALDDLPGHAQRFARWRSRRDAGLVRRISPLRPGRPPGQHAASSRRPAHEIYEVLGDLQWFAFKALERPDTS